MPSNLTAHLQEAHGVNPLNTYLREIVYGGSDGIVTTFAVVAGFAGAQGSHPIDSAFPFLTVLLFGLANLFADGSSMALGNFLSTRAGQDLYKSESLKEAREINKNPNHEFQETVDILTKNKGFSQEDAEAIAKRYQKNPTYWTEFMMTHELEMQNPEGENPTLMALATFVSFTFFGFIPLVPYVFFRGDPNSFLISIFFTGFALVLLGVLRWVVTRIHPLRSIGEVVAIGSISAAIAYIVGIFFR